MIILTTGVDDLSQRFVCHFNFLVINFHLQSAFTFKWIQGILFGGESDRESRCWIENCLTSPLHRIPVILPQREQVWTWGFDKKCREASPTWQKFWSLGLFQMNKPVKAGVSHWKALFTSSLFDAKLLWSVWSIELLQKKMHFGTEQPWRRISMKWTHWKAIHGNPGCTRDKLQKSMSHLISKREHDSPKPENHLAGLNNGNVREKEEQTVSEGW